MKLLPLQFRFANIDSLYHFTILGIKKIQAFGCG